MWWAKSAPLVVIGLTEVSNSGSAKAASLSILLNSFNDFVDFGVIGSKLENFN